MKRIAKALSVVLSILLLAQFAIVGASAQTDPSLYKFLRKVGISKPKAASLAANIEGWELIGEEVSVPNLKAYMNAWDDDDLGQIPFDVGSWVDQILDYSQSPDAVAFMRGPGGGSYMATFFTREQIKDTYASESITYQKLSVSFYDYLQDVANRLRSAFTAVLGFDRANYLMRESMIKSIVRYYLWVLTDGNLTVLLGDTKAPVNVRTSEEVRRVMYGMMNDAMGLAFYDPDVSKVLPGVIALKISKLGALWDDPGLDGMKCPILNPTALSNIWDYAFNCAAMYFEAEPTNGPLDEYFAGKFGKIFDHIDETYKEIENGILVDSTVPLVMNVDLGGFAPERVENIVIMGVLILVTELVLISVSPLEFTMITGNL